MKVKSLIIALLLILVIIGSHITKVFLPLWGYSLYTAIVLILLVYYVLNLWINEKAHFEGKISALDDKLDNVQNDLVQQQIVQRDIIISSLEEKHGIIKDLINNSIASINEVLANETNSIIAHINVQSEAIETMFNKEQEQILSLAQTTKELHVQILEKINSDTRTIEEQIIGLIEEVRKEGVDIRSDINEASNLLQSSLNTQKEVLENSIEKTASSIIGISKEFNAEINSAIAHLEDQGIEALTIIQKNIDNLLITLKSQKESIENSIDVSTQSIIDISKECNANMHTSFSNLSSQGLESRTAISGSLEDIIQKAEEMKLLIKSSQEQVKTTVNLKGQEMVEGILKCATDTANIIDESFNKTQLSLTEIRDSLLQSEESNTKTINSHVNSTIEKTEELTEMVASYSSKLEKTLALTKAQTEDIFQNVESIRQQNNNVQTLITATNTAVSNMSENLRINSEQDKSLILERITESGTEIANTINGEIENALSSITDCLKNVNDTYTKSETSILQSHSEQKEEINNALQSIQEHYTALQDKIENASNGISNKTSEIKEGFILSIQEVKECIVTEGLKNKESVATDISEALSIIEERVEKIDESSNENSEILSETLKSEGDRIVSKIDSIEKQNIGMAKDVNSFAESNKENENRIHQIKEQCEEMQKELANVRIQSHNVEAALNNLATKIPNSSIIDSIKSLISELNKELKIHLTEINDGILDTQIKQEQSNDQIKKLQLLLKSLNIGKGSLDSTKGGKPSASQTTSQSKGDQAPIALASSNPNRTDVIVDDDTQNVVYNQYINNQLVKSTMKDRAGTLLYELEYNNGKIFKSRNYDAKGNLNIEQTYYDNGQVHYRNEITKKGKISTEFDRNGNKKS